MVQLDGEPVQIEVYKDPPLLEKLLDRNIVIGKPPDSTTENTQPCDARHCFIGPKTALKKINNCDLVGKDWMRYSLGSILKELEDKNGALPVHLKKLFTNNLLRVQLALQNSIH